ncbi:hypothetical protein H2200_000038 [Cladophialophora chaetospira]|uniref:Uncharacterized protein n=1 Tax=Cladophialophora chaetospira TaxID=386627 RepID=A0AA38XMN1_9EURO|nr:hypothetical protein H2200_000038 [Cladophialophora chaetospira]
MEKATEEQNTLHEDKRVKTKEQKRQEKFDAVKQALQADIKAMVEPKMKAFAAEMKAMEAETKAMKAETKAMEAEMEATKAETKALQAEMEATKAEIEAGKQRVERQFAKLELGTASLEAQVARLRPNVLVPQQAIPTPSPFGMARDILATHALASQSRSNPPRN